MENKLCIEVKDSKNIDCNELSSICKRLKQDYKEIRDVRQTMISFIEKEFTFGRDPKYNFDQLPVDIKFQNESENCIMLNSLCYSLHLNDEVS